MEESTELVDKLWENGNYFKSEMKTFGFDSVISHPAIIPVMLGDAKLARDFCRLLFENSVFAIAIGFTNTPSGETESE